MNMAKRNQLELLQKLITLIKDKDELYGIEYGSINHTMRHTFIKSIKSVIDENINLSESLLKIESVIDYLNDELNTGHWSQVPVYIRRYFTTASYVKCLVLLKGHEDNIIELLKECLKCIDLGLLLGAPLDTNCDLLTDSAVLLRKEINKFDSYTDKTEVKESTSRVGIEKTNKFFKLNGCIVDIVKCPSLESFNKKYFTKQVPVKLKGCLEHWPALSKWSNINYLLEIAGNRTVPIEIGSHYVDENWSQKLINFKEFVTDYYLNDNGNIGYLAQHNLFEQIIELRNDICIPEYCSLSLDDDNTTEPDINAWFGPEGTVSPLHTDPKNNLLAQVFGTKQVILYSPQDTPGLYPYEDKLLNNTSQVNPIHPDLEKYPKFVKCTMFKCLLEPGDMLFIPVKWWHHVTALERSFSVSFWWQ